VKDQSKRFEAGFTLIEMLVALAIFSLLSAGATTAMVAALKTKTQVSDATDELTALETSRALMRSDLNNIILRPSRDPFGSREIYLMSGGSESLLTFSRGGRENPGGLEKRGSIQRVAYVFEDDKLIRRSYAVDNPAPLTPLRDRVLLDNLEDVTVSFEKEQLTFNQIFMRPDQLEVPADMFVLTVRFAGGAELVQKFELDPL